jgi:very-short-patch-repair endonuclease
VRGRQIEDKRQIHLAKGLRRRQTDAEILLWDKLRNKQLNGVKFRRQHCVGKYIVDFVCLKKKLIIEIDGGHHNEPDVKREDDRRTKWLEAEGYKIVRFWDNDVLQNIEGVALDIMGRL